MSIGAFFLTGFSNSETCGLRSCERDELSSFFRFLFQKSEFGYTLFGQKPMSFYSYFIKFPPECLIFSSFTDPKIETHYQTYNKYKDKFSFKIILFLINCVFRRNFLHQE